MEEFAWSLPPMELSRENENEPLGNIHQLAYLEVWIQGLDQFCAGWNVLGVSPEGSLLERHWKTHVREV